MRISILEALENIESQPKSLLEDGEGATAAQVGDAAIDAATQPAGSSVAGVNSTSDVATYPQYLGMSFRGGRSVRMNNKSRSVPKRKRLLEESLSHYAGSIMEEFNSTFSKSKQFESILPED